MEYNFVEVIKQFDRMCQKYNNRCSPKECPICALIGQWEAYYNKAWGDKCLDFAKQWPDRFVEEVIKWAKSHDEPIYPTIREVVNKLCLMMGYEQTNNLEDFLDTRLSEKAADYFDIEPINKDKLV